MLKMRVLALAITIGLTLSSAVALAAVDPDGCDSDLWNDMQAKSDEGFLNLAGDGDANPGLVGSIMKPPSSIMRDDCANGAFNIWNTGSMGGLDTLTETEDSMGFTVLKGLITAFLGGSSFSNIFSGIAGQSLTCDGFWNDNIKTANSTVSFKNFGDGGAIFKINPADIIPSTKSFNITDILANLF